MVAIYNLIIIKMLSKNLYSICLSMYLLWWVSVFIIANEGLHLAQDMPWFILFTLILFISWFFKYKFYGDQKFLFHENISSINLAAHLLLISIFSILMIFFS